MHLLLHPLHLYHITLSLWHDGVIDSDKCSHQKYVVTSPGTEHINLHHIYWCPPFLGCNTFQYLIEPRNSGWPLFHYHIHTLSTPTHLIQNQQQFLWYTQKCFFRYPFAPPSICYVGVALNVWIVLTGTIGTSMILLVNFLKKEQIFIFFLLLGGSPIS